MGRHGTNEMAGIRLTKTCEVAMEGERVSSQFRINSSRTHSWLIWLVGGLVAWAMLSLLPGTAPGQEAEWIWTPEHKKDAVPQSAAYFRKSFTLRAPTAGQVTLIADDFYELYVNGKRIGTGEMTKSLTRYDIARFLTRGRNTIALKVTNRNGTTAALAARVMIQENNKWISHSTDGTWVTSTGALPLWNSTVYNDSRWDRAQVFGRLGDTAPWDLEEGVASEERHKATPDPYDQKQNRRCWLHDILPYIEPAGCFPVFRLTSRPIVPG
jgi:hypothetical protein